MEESSLIQLKSPYNSYVEDGKWDEYIYALCDDGLTWWFNMDTPAIISHLIPLQKITLDTRQFPPRILFLSEAVKQSIPLDSMDKFYRLFMSAGDYEAACACAGAGIASIWDSGHNYHRYDSWYGRIKKLLDIKEKISPLAISSLYGFKAMAELTGHGKVQQALDSYKSLRLWAEKAGSTSLRVFYSAAASYSLLWIGRLSEADILLSDAGILCKHPDTSTICRIYFQTTLGLFHTVSGNPGLGEQVLMEIINLPFFEMLPPPVYFLAYGHLLHALSHNGNSEAVEKTADKVRARAIPEQNYFHYSYLHFNLGIAYLGINQPHRALLHSDEAIDRGRLSESPIAVQMPALLHGQALSDLGRDREALKYFLDWIQRWKESGFQLLASAGALEVANLYKKMGMPDQARQYLDMASSLMPEGEKIPQLHRTKEFLSRLEHSLFHSEEESDVIRDLEQSPVRIRDFGNMRIEIGDTVIYDRRWKGGRTRLLLKALIVSGGTKVAYEHLADTLWPDADGDRAEQNLKVALSRLRRLGCRKGEEPIQWIAVKNKKVSLVRPLCAVDSIVFREGIRKAIEKEPDMSLLMKTLDLYSDDFLALDNSDPSTVRHRELLRELFVKGVLTLSELCMKAGRIEDSIPYLHRAIDKDPLYEEVYVHLMHSYMETYPSKAVQIFNQAKETLKRELDIEPGPALISAARKAGITE